MSAAYIWADESISTQFFLGGSVESITFNFDGETQNHGFTENVIIYGIEAY